jgi:hypothetical protein
MKTNQSNKTKVARPTRERISKGDEGGTISYISMCDRFFIDKLKSISSLHYPQFDPIRLNLLELDPHFDYTGLSKWSSSTITPRSRHGERQDGEPPDWVALVGLGSPLVEGISCRLASPSDNDADEEVRSLLRINAVYADKDEWNCRHQMLSPILGFRLLWFATLPQHFQRREFDSQRLIGFPLSSIQPSKRFHPSSPPRNISSLASPKPATASSRRYCSSPQLPYSRIDSNLFLR